MFISDQCPHHRYSHDKNVTYQSDIKGLHMWEIGTSISWEKQTKNPWTIYLFLSDCFRFWYHTEMNKLWFPVHQKPSQSFQCTDEQIFWISHSHIKTARKTVLFPAIYSWNSMFLLYRNILQLTTLIFHPLL